MSLERIQGLLAKFRARVATCEPAPPHAPSDELARLGPELLESMLLARHLDLQAHALRASGDGHYTICSSGHEGNVVFGRLTRPSDPALLHYRSAALQVERARYVPELDPALDIALSLVASRDDPMSGGRHKVFGHPKLGILPQTSTIASHLPRAVGMALALERRRRMGLEPSYPEDALVLASFGDASLNHSTLVGALNTAGWILHQRLTLPLLCVCEDNGLGISVRSPEGWTELRLRALPHIRYFACDGWSLGDTLRVAGEAVEYCRSSRRAAVVHLRCARLLGHAGSDVDTSYRTAAEIAEAEARDPVLCAALELVAHGVLERERVLELDARAERRAVDAAGIARARPKLRDRVDVMRSICKPVGAALAREAELGAPAMNQRPLTLGQAINGVLGEALARYPETLVFGEDVARKGGVYGITKGLLAQAGPKRVFNTLLDEQSILGFALGAASLGLLPIPELQYLAYLHNAEDQLRGEAATLPFFSDGACDNPLLVRIAGLAYQKGFGGHFHNDNSLAVLRDIPGLVVFVPARADDAVALYRTALALCRIGRRVVVAVEPIALYHTRDLYEPGDSAWLAAPSEPAAEFARARVYDAGANDLTIVTYGNGVFMSLRAARELQRAHGRHARVLDLRWISPLPLADVLEHTRQTGRALIVDECRRSGNVSEAIAAALGEASPPLPFARVTSADSFVPLGSAAEHVLVGEREIVEAALGLLGRA